MEYQKLTKRDKFLVCHAISFLKKNYKHNQHHVASILRTKTKFYKSLHLDSNGFDVCAEPIAISKAFYKNDRNFTIIVSVIKKKNKFKVVNPCGNCRQILLQYCPNIFVVITRKDGKIRKCRVEELLPCPYV